MSADAGPLRHCRSPAAARRPGPGMRARRRAGPRDADRRHRSRPLRRHGRGRATSAPRPSSAGSKRLLAALGIWPALTEHAQPVTAVDITDSALEDAFRPVLVSYDNTVEGGEPATYIIENERLHEAHPGGRRTRGRPSARRAAMPVAGLRGRPSWRHRRHSQTAAAARAAARRGRRPRLAPARSRRHRRRRLAVSADRHRHHRRAREAAQRPRHAALPARGPVCDPAAQGNRSCVTWTEDESAAADRGPRRWPASREVEKRFGFRLGRPSGRATRRVAAGDAPGARAGGRPSGAGRRRCAPCASDRRPRPEPGPAGCCGPDRGRGRRGAARPRHRLQHRALALRALAAHRCGAVGCRLRRAQSPVLQRLDAAAYRARAPAWAWSTGCRR